MIYFLKIFTKIFIQNEKVADTQNLQLINFRLGSNSLS